MRHMETGIIAAALAVLTFTTCLSAYRLAEVKEENRILKVGRSNLVHASRVADARGDSCPYGAVQTYGGGEALCLTETARAALAEDCYLGLEWACGEPVAVHEDHSAEECILDPVGD